jgi:hypothetical protein
MMTLVKSLHSGDPRHDSNFKHADLQVSDIQSASFASVIRVKAVKSVLPISLNQACSPRH